jgi:putative NADH-flavin reductase
MRIAVIGGTGMIGSAVVRCALDHGHDVSVLARDVSALVEVPRISAIAGDARDFEPVIAAVTGADAVVSAVGPRRNEPESVVVMETVARNVVAAMRAQHVDRLVFVAGAGVAFPGETFGLGQRAATAVVRLLARWIVRAKEREADIFRGSGLSWSAVRPVRVHAGAPSGRVRQSADRPGGLRATSGDVALVTVRLATDPTANGVAPFVWTDSERRLRTAYNRPASR